MSSVNVDLMPRSSNSTFPVIPSSVDYKTKKWSQVNSNYRTKMSQKCEHYLEFVDVKCALTV